MLTFRVHRIYSPRFLIGSFAVLVVYCVFIIIATSAIFEGKKHDTLWGPAQFEAEINLKAPNIRSANNFPWEIHVDGAERVARKHPESQQIAKSDKHGVENEAVENKRAVEKKPSNVQGDAFMDKQLRVQTLRRSQLDEVCKNNPTLSNGNISHDTLRHIYVHEPTKVLYCFVPKVGCSNWKRVLMKLGGNKKPIGDITSNEAHFHNGMKRLVGYNVEDRHLMLRTYKKFMFARHPFVRILSAYKNKYQDRTQYLKETYFHRFAKRIMKNYRKNPSEHDLKTGEGITWGEFAQYLADPKQYGGFDDHWEEMYRLCAPCRIGYNYYGKLETITDDAAYILKLIKADGNVSYPARANSHPTNSTNEFDHLYGQLNTKILRRLWEIYHLDFELFGYEKPSIIIKAIA